MIAEGMQGNRKDGPARKFVLVSEMLKEQGVACGGLVGIGIAFVQDDLGKFVISHSVFPDASLRIGEILTHVDGTALSTLKSPGDLGRLMLGPQGSKVEVRMFVLRVCAVGWLGDDSDRCADRRARRDGNLGTTGRSHTPPPAFRLPSSSR